MPWYCQQNWALQLKSVLTMKFYDCHENVVVMTPMEIKCEIFFQISRFLYESHSVFYGVRTIQKVTSLEFFTNDNIKSHFWRNSTHRMDDKLFVIHPIQQNVAS